MKYVHGSTSAGLEGVFDLDYAGLSPTGKLIKDRRVPFGGELRYGLAAGGVNQDCISMVPMSRLFVALDYAQGDKGWDPEQSEKISNELRGRLNLNISLS